MKRRVFALFGVVAVLLTATMSLTLSRVTLSAGVGSLKCYDKVGIEKACWPSRSRLLSICERAQAVSHETRKRQHQQRCTAKCEKNLGCDANHRPMMIRDIP
jgi:hypothetical protein